MKKIIFSVLFSAVVLAGHAQSFDYSTAAGWGANIRSILPALPGCVSPLGSLGNATNNKIDISSGRLNFTSVRGAQENRLAINLGTAYDQTFNMDFDFNLANLPASGAGRAVFLALLRSC